MAAPSRKNRRDRMKTLLEATELYQAVYASQPKNFDGQSPVATVHSGAMTSEEMTFAGAYELGLGIVVTHFVKRDGSDTDTVEDQLDALLVGLMDLVADNQADALWPNGLEIGNTRPDYFDVDGVEYRGETIELRPKIFFT